MDILFGKWKESYEVVWFHIDRENRF
jgi:hypothetical protein